MEGKGLTLTIAMVIGAILASQGCQSAPPPAISDISGTHFAEGAVIQVDKNSSQAILSLFKEAEDAVHREDLDALMTLYSDHYSHGGYTKDDVRAFWRDLFKHYHDFSVAHIFSVIKMDMRQKLLVAHVTCTGYVVAISNETGQRVNIDSWLGEVHHLTFEHERWHLGGTFWEIPRAKESRPAIMPHPFF
jgi:hypothetical protein